jgi:hypothetical protein
VRHNGAVTVDEASAENGEADELVEFDNGPGGLDETDVVDEAMPEGGEPR